jgi:hypothetical protein
MKSAIAGWVAIVLFGALPSPTLTAESFCLDVASARTGDLPAGWSIAKTGEGPGGVWAVVEDATAPGGKAVAQASDQGPNRLFCICVADGTSFKDVDLTVSFKAVAGKLDQGGGPVWRYRDANNYFGLWWKPDEYVFYVDGKETWRSKAGGVCQVPEYILLSDEIGNWAGDIAKAKLPDQFCVDYVRVYDLVENK